MYNQIHALLLGALLPLMLIVSCAATQLIDDYKECLLR